MVTREQSRRRQGGCASAVPRCLFASSCRRPVEPDRFQTPATVECSWNVVAVVGQDGCSEKLVLGATRARSPSRWNTVTSASQPAYRTGTGGIAIPVGHLQASRWGLGAGSHSYSTCTISYGGTMAPEFELALCCICRLSASVSMIASTRTGQWLACLSIPAREGVRLLVPWTKAWFSTT